MSGDGSFVVHIGQLDNTRNSWVIVVLCVYILVQYSL